MDSSSDCYQRIPIATSRKGTRALPSLPQQLLLLLLVGPGVPVKEYDGFGVRAPAKEHRVSRIQLKSKD